MASHEQRVRTCCVQQRLDSRAVRKNCVYYAGNCEVSPGQAEQIALAIEREVRAVVAAPNPRMQRTISRLQQQIQDLKKSRDYWQREGANAYKQATREQDPVAVRYGFDGYGWMYCDNGHGSDWQTRHPDGELLYPPRTEE